MAERERERGFWHAQFSLAFCKMLLAKIGVHEAALYLVNVLQISSFFAGIFIYAYIL